MLRVAMPVSGDYLSEQFKDCTSYQLFDIDDKGKVNKTNNVLPELFIEVLPELENEYGITDLIVHTIDQDSLRHISDSKINLFIGVSINAPQQLIDAYLKGTLKSNTHIIKEEKEKAQ